jgi:flagellar hook-length control protein FliK
VLSVPSDLAASVALQTAPPKAPRPEASQPSEQFGNILDSSAPARASDATGPEQPARPPASRSGDGASGPVSTSAPREPASSDQTPRLTEDDRDAGGGPAPAMKTTASRASGTAESSVSGKSPGAKTGNEKSGADGAKDATNSADQMVAQPDATLATAINAVAVAVAGPTVPVQAASPVGSNGGSEPLVLAAAGIAASASTTADVATSTQAQAVPGGEATLSDAENALAPAVSTDTAQATATKPEVEAATAGALAASAAPVKQSTGQASTVVATGIDLTAAAPATPAPLKPAPIKAAASAPTKVAASSTVDATAATSDPPATATAADRKPNEIQQGQFGQQLPSSATGKQPTGTEAVTAAKQDGGDINAGPSGAPGSHDRASLAVTTQAVTASSDAGPTSNASLQPPVAPGQPAPLPQINVAPTGVLTAAAPTGAPVPLSGLAVEIAAFAKSGKTRFDVRLDPADLGRIDVRIDVDRHGQITSHLTVEKPETLSMLRQDAPQLQRALNDAGLKTGSNGLQFSLRDQSGSGQNNGNNAGGNAQRLVISEDETVPASMVGLSYGRLIRSSGGVDIRV